MNKSIALKKIPQEDYSAYRYQVIFKAYKWDPQVEDANTVSPYVAILKAEEVAKLAELAEQLAKETVAMESELLADLTYAKKLGLPKSMRRAMKRAKNYQSNQHVRLMRFDFHPTDEGWKISEVNSDVPGGFAESSILPEIAAEYVKGTYPAENFAEHLFKGFEKKIKIGGTIGFVHATSYADDRQVMQFMGDYIESKGYHALYLAPDHLIFKERRAYSRLGDDIQELSGIIRFFPLEWMPRLPFSAKWQDYYSTVTPSCNHPVAMLTQPKSLPLFWDCLNTNPQTWRKLLPETKAATQLRFDQADYLYKPVFGRVGEDITLREVTTEKDFKKIKKEVRLHPKDWIIQKRFNSLPIEAEGGELFHLCLGVFVIEGKFAGFYGRISPHPHIRIDEKAMDIPVLIKEGGQ